MSTLIDAADALAEALAEENAALAKLDIDGATRLLARKRDAVAALQAARETTRNEGVKLPEDLRARVEATAHRLDVAARENKRLLERAMYVQRRVLETLAHAVRLGRTPSYGATGRVCDRARATPLALSARI